MTFLTNLTALTISIACPGCVIILLLPKSPSHQVCCAGDEYTQVVCDSPSASLCSGTSLWRCVANYECAIEYSSLLNGARRLMDALACFYRQTTTSCLPLNVRSADVCSVANVIMAWCFWDLTTTCFLLYIRGSPQKGFSISHAVILFVLGNSHLKGINEITVWCKGKTRVLVCSENSVPFLEKWESLAIL